MILNNSNFKSNNRLLFSNDSRKTEKMTFLFVKRMSYTYKCVIDEY